MVRKFISAVLFASFLVASQADVTDGMMIEQFVFQTTGKDCYDDNTPVMPRETYAVVWMRTGVDFPGFPMIPPEPDTWMVSNDVRVAVYLSCASQKEKDGAPWSKCPRKTLPAGFLQPPELATNGSWTVYLLDTRHQLANGSIACGSAVDELTPPVRINAFTPISGLENFKLDLTRSPVVKLVLTGGVETVATVANRKTDVIRRAISFNAQGGTSLVPSRELVYGDAYGELPVPTCEGCEFDGWYTEPSGGERVSADILATKDVTVYAHWKDCYIVNFDPGEGTGKMEAKVCRVDCVHKLPPCGFTEPQDKHFAGWVRESPEPRRYDPEMLFFNLGKAGDVITLKAIWEE